MAEREVAEASDVILIHGNGCTRQRLYNMIRTIRSWGLNRPIVCNEDDKQGETAAWAVELCVTNGASWGLMLNTLNQYFPLEFHGAADDSVVYRKLKELTSR